MPTYQLAFVMADYLIERDGLARVVDYYRSFGEGRRRREAFQHAFGQSLEQFEREVLGHLRSIVPRHS